MSAKMFERRTPNKPETESLAEFCSYLWFTIFWKIPTGTPSFCARSDISKKEIQPDAAVK